MEITTLISAIGLGIDHVKNIGWLGPCMLISLFILAQLAKANGDQVFHKEYLANHVTSEAIYHIGFLS